MRGAQLSRKASNGGQPAADSGKEWSLPASVLVSAPLQRRANSIPVAQKDVVAHSDFLAVIDHRSAGKREQEEVEQFDAFAVFLEQRPEPAADSEIDPRFGVAGVDAIHVIT